MTAPRESRLDAAEIHRRLAGGWPSVLERLGIAPEYLRDRHGPCPACGGTDRYRFDDKHQRGDFFCNACGAGDGFKLLQLVHRWSFSEARRAVVDAMGGRKVPNLPARERAHVAQPEIAQPTARVKSLLRTCTTPDAVSDAIDYLLSRRLWPLPAGCILRAHVGVDYYHAALGNSHQPIGRFAALLAPVVYFRGERVPAHVTYLADGQKAQVESPRKILSPMIGRMGCAVRLLPLAGGVLGIAEGIETALAASALHDGVAVWAALNTRLLAKFEPPPEVWRLLIFADRDVAGLEAAWHLRDRLGDRLAVELRVPPASADDWADVLQAQRP